MKKVYSLLLLMIISTSYGVPSAGNIAKDMTQGLHGASTIIHTIFILVGIGLITLSFIKYHERRNNPEQNSIGAVIALLLVGLALIALAFIPMPK